MPGWDTTSLSNARLTPRFDKPHLTIAKRKRRSKLFQRGRVFEERRKEWKGKRREGTALRKIIVIAHCTAIYTSVGGGVPISWPVS